MLCVRDMFCIALNVYLVSLLFSLFYVGLGHAGASGLAVKRWTCDHLGRGFESHRSHLRNNLGQVVHTCASVTKQYNLVLVGGR